MKTREARRLKKASLRQARMCGHKPALISDEGALHLYGCLNDDCYLLLECWDNPLGAGGRMIHDPCINGLKQSRWKRIVYKLYMFMSHVTE